MQKLKKRIKYKKIEKKEKGKLPMVRLSGESANLIIGNGDAG